MGDAAPAPPLPPTTTPTPLTTTPMTMPPSAERPRDPAEALLSVRDADGVEDEAPSPEEAELFERVRRERERRRTVRRSAAMAVAALLLLVAAVAVALRAPRTQESASVPDEVPATAPPSAAETPSAVATTTPAPPTTDARPAPVERTPKRRAVARAPETAREPANTPEAPPRAGARAPETAREPARGPEPAPRAVTPEPEPTQEPASGPELPPRASRAAARTEPRRTPAPRSEPAAMPRAMEPSPPVRVQVAQTPSGGAVDYRVRVSRPDGAPVTDADVRLRGVMSDGAVVEARLEPGNEPGMYHSLLAFSSRGPRALTLRVAGTDGVVEVPVGEPAPGGSGRP